LALMLAYGGGDDTEHELSLSPTANSWNTFNLKLSDFTNLAGKKHIAQLIFAGLPTGAGVVYLDNIYYSKAPYFNRRKHYCFESIVILTLLNNL